MSAASFLHHGDCLPHLPPSFEVPKNQYVVSKIANIDGRLHRTSNQSHLRKYEKRQNPLVVEVRQQFVQVQSKELFPRHSLKESIQAVDENGAGISLLHRFADQVDKLAWGYLCRVKMLNLEAA